MEKQSKTIFGIIFITLLLVGTGIAIGASLNNKQIYVPEQPIGIKGNLTFNALESDISSCYINEPDGKIDEDDIQRCLKQAGVKGSVTDIKDWNDEYLKEDGSWEKEGIEK